MENEYKNIINLYHNHAVDWDRERGRRLFEKPWLDRMMTLLPPKRSILDLGCGSGEPIARYFIERGCSVTGVDSSSPLVGICSSRFPGQDWLIADMRMLSLGRRFDGILAWNSLFHLCPDDQRQMFPIFGRHAARGAALMFTSGPSHGEAIGTYKGERLYHASLDGGEYRSLLDRNGFDVVSHVVEDASCGGHTIWLAQSRIVEGDGGG
jgi:SAM-dependent methyltransferase